MKYVVYALMLTLSGCGTVDMVKERYFNNRLLDTAPQERTDVQHPEWGDAPKVSYVSSPQAVHKTQSSQQMAYTEHKNVPTITSLTNFLSTQHIDYELLPGNYSIVRVNRAIQFNAGSDDVSYASRAWIFKVSDYLSGIKNKNVEVVIDGHTDKTGNDSRNDKLSRQRAEAVKALLADAPNVSVDSIYARGYSDVLPACNNVSNFGRSCNRRVELFFIVAP